MDIAIHLGAHCTDEDLILRTLTENAALLEREGVHLPPGNKARPALRRALQGAEKQRSAPSGTVLDALLQGRSAERMVLSYEGFLGTYATALAGDRLYPEAGHRCDLLGQIFAGHAVTFHLAIRNPATFVPALFQASSVDRFSDFLQGHDLAKIAWSDPVDAIRKACPQIPLVVWCNEDLPLVWPDVLRRLAGTEAPLEGENAVLGQIMTPEGFRRLELYLKDNPPANLSTWRKVVTAFLGKYADEALVEPEIALPGWSQDMIAGLSDLYERDVERLKAMKDLTFIAP